MGDPMQSNSCDEKLEVFRSLSKEEIDRKIEVLVAELAAPVDEQGDGTPAEADCTPRWISPAELVRRMRPFIVLS